MSDDGAARQAGARPPAARLRRPPLRQRRRPGARRRAGRGARGRRDPVGPGRVPRPACRAAARPLAWLLERLFGRGVTRIEWSEVSGPRRRTSSCASDAPDLRPRRRRRQRRRADREDPGLLMRLTDLINCPLRDRGRPRARPRVRVPGAQRGGKLEVEDLLLGRHALVERYGAGRHRPPAQAQGRHGARGALERRGPDRGGPRRRSPLTASDALITTDGGSGIRTHETASQRASGFQDRPVRPLRHPARRQQC